ncbi:TPA: hypothetical protein ACYLN4_007257 [Burkholderia lata]
MKSTPTPWTHVGVTTEELAVTFGPGRLKHEVTVPAGTKCRKLEGGDNPWVVSDLTFIADKNGGMYWDADHYGIRISEEKITDIQPHG